MNPNTNDLQRFTLEQFETMKKEEHCHYELIDGIVFMSPSPSREHQFAAHQIHGLLYNLLSKSPCQAAGELDVQYNHNVYKPDLMVFCNKDAEHPEIIFEILSPSTRHRDLGIKVIKYEEMGVKEYWIIDLKIKTVTVHDFVHQTAETYGIDESIQSLAQPDIKIAVADIFAF